MDEANDPGMQQNAGVAGAPANDPGMQQNAGSVGGERSVRTPPGTEEGNPGGYLPPPHTGDPSSVPAGHPFGWRSARRGIGWLGKMAVPAVLVVAGIGAGIGIGFGVWGGSSPDSAVARAQSPWPGGSGSPGGPYGQRMYGPEWRYGPGMMGSGGPSGSGSSQLPPYGPYAGR